MNQSETCFTVFFENPFWVGVYERCCNGRLEACKITFGAEPTDAQVYAFLQRNWPILRFSPPVAQKSAGQHKTNPKRMQRAIHSQLTSTGVGTKAQQALKLQQESEKTERKKLFRKKTEEEQSLRFEQKRQKRKEAHRGK